MVQDIRRIKTQGPSMDDLVLVARQQYVETGKGEPKGAVSREVQEGDLFTWVPPSVLGTGVVEHEPRWAGMPRMSLLEFYAGLQRRNWTSPHHDPAAVPWKLDFYQVRNLP